MSNKNIKAIHDDDLTHFLQSIGLLTSIESGKIRCMCCNDTVTLKTFYAAIPEAGTIKIICSKPSCIKNIN